MAGAVLCGGQSSGAAPEPLGPFARGIDEDTFSHAFGFLAPQDLVQVGGVCRSWAHFMDTTDQWKSCCQQALNIPASMDPARFLPEGISYKDAARAGVKTKVFNERTYRHLGIAIGEVPPIPDAIALTRSGERDPCHRMPDPRDRDGTVGQNYVWMWSPSDLEIEVGEDFPFELREVGGTPENGPSLMPKEAGAAAGHAERTVRTTRLRVPNTIHNLGVLFRHLNKGQYDDMWHPISVQLGNKRIREGWVCMREAVVARNRTIEEQQDDVRARGVVIAQLGHRILFNLLMHAETGTYPDGRNPLTFARTSTRTVPARGSGRLALGCGDGGPSGLNVSGDDIPKDSVGVAVALSPEAQAVDL